MRAERRLGQLIRAQKETVGLAPGGQPYQSTGSAKEPVERTPTLAEIGIDKKLSSLAPVPPPRLSRSISDVLSHHGRHFLPAIIAEYLSQVLPIGPDLELLAAHGPGVGCQGFF